MSMPIGSLSELKEQLEGSGKQYVFEEGRFPFYSVLIYSHIRGLNSHLHAYVMNNFDLFNAQTGPNWLVAVLEDIQDTKHDLFKPEDVYQIARFLGVRVDEIPALVFFTDPKKRNDIYILKLSEIIHESAEYDEEGINKIFSKMAAIIDDICRKDAESIDRIDVLQSVFNTEFTKLDYHSEDNSSVQGLLRKASSTATSVFTAIVDAVKAYKVILGIFA